RLPMPADETGEDCREEADDEQGPPSQRSDDGSGDHGGGEDSELESHTHPRVRPGTLIGSNRLGGQGHADAELPTDADAGDETVGGHVPVALRDRGQSGEYGEDEHGPGQHPDTTAAIGESAGDEPAEHRPEPSDRRQGTGFDLAEAE